MSKEILMLVDVLATEKNLDKDFVFESLEKALAIASKKSFEGEFPDIDVVIDRSTGKYKTVRKWTIKDLAIDQEELDHDKEISLEEAFKKYSNVEHGDTIEEEIENIELGRVSAQTARNVIAQRIKDAEREHILNEYLSRNRGVVIGKVRKFERGNIIVDCGRIEAIIFKADVIPHEVIQPGDQIKGYLDKNDLNVKNGRVSISRACNGFLAKLLESNVPEVAAGRVEIKGIAREPGVRAKVAVYSNDARIDAKGACIGFRNQRIESISQELFGENIDVIDYDRDIAQYAINALAPAEIQSIVVDEDKKIVDVIVADENLANAIGTNGINVTLASKLIGYVINILGADAAIDKQNDEKLDAMKLFNDSLDIDDDISEVLVSNGFTTLEEVAYVEPSELSGIDEFDEDLASELQDRAKNKLISKTLKYKDKMDKLSSELNQVVKLSKEVLMLLVENNINNMSDFADLSGDELMEIIGVDTDTANKLVMKAREVSGYFNE
jgi:transcription termination/antitermination protein NusA